MNLNIRSQHAFTLIELMIALVLGLLISATALALFLNANRSLNFQSGMSNLQQNSNFGLSIMTHDIRHANLNMPSEQTVNNLTVGSGVIFSLANLPSNLTVSTDLLTRQAATLDSTAEEKSDQLTIQFVPDLRGANQFDCEGNAIVPNQTYVYRYYLNELPADQQPVAGMTRYGLYCDAGYYSETSNSITGLDSNGQLVLQNVDAFKIRFLVKNPSKQLRYMTTKQYLDSMPSNTASSQYNQIGGVELGLLIVASESIGADAHLNDKTEFTIAGQDVVLKPNTRNSQYLRQPVTQVVSFRNTLGAF